MKSYVPSDSYLAYSTKKFRSVFISTHRHWFSIKFNIWILCLKNLGPLSVFYATWLNYLGSRQHKQLLKMSQGVFETDYVLCSSLGFSLEFLLWSNVLYCGIFLWSKTQASKFCMKLTRIYSLLRTQHDWNLHDPSCCFQYMEQVIILHLSFISSLHIFSRLCALVTFTPTFRFYPNSLNCIECNMFC